MTELDSQYAKLGFWTDWDRGSILGHTLTVNARTGNVIIVLLTILSALSTIQLWELVTFLHYQYRADKNPSDGFFWQQQVLMRSLPTPASMFNGMIRIWWTWREKTDRPLIRTLIPLFLSLGFIIATLAASISTSWIVSTSDLVVLVSSPSCSYINFTAFNDMNDSDSLQIARRIATMVEPYSLNCYENEGFLPMLCRTTFTRPNISFSTSQDPCPWVASMCPEVPKPAITMDSGLLDASADLGFNIPRKEGVKFRRRTTCNILPLEGHYINRKMSYWGNRVSSAISDDEGIGYRYGNWGIEGVDHPEDTFISSSKAHNSVRAYDTR